MFSSNYLIPNGDNNYQAKYVSAYTGEARNTSTYPVDVFLYNYSTSNLYDYYGETSSRSTTTHTVGINTTALHTVGIKSLIGKQATIVFIHATAVSHSSQPHSCYTATLPPFASSLYISKALISRNNTSD